ncbi:MAG TPA: bifunctional phosphopantothenoylcysteine decarboxylase/phosphopantothenate--cysteine ligase CoaBC [Burkholderiaceae bacterium]|nr:bifunctional phosphopantothenoylcysteine decarboxylase/phosphopantothenate--cysteine ligase CoaBC [Burkholderiaceae bacterium]
MQLNGKHLVVGMTGGIAAYKVCELVRRVQDEGATVQVVMTAAAQQFVSALTMQALSGRPIETDQWKSSSGNAMPHIELTRNADAVIVAPATADFLAKLAHGLADDLLTALSLARDRARTALLVAPAMNVEMWDNPATQRNVAQLRADGVTICGPTSGAQACGETGLGRMLEAHELLEDVISFFQPKLLAGKKVLLTAGPTFEPIDPVRGLTNLSSGKTGFALTRAARDAGAQVTLIAGPTALATPRGVKRIDVTTAREMMNAVMDQLPADVFISVAAVADWHVTNPSANKIKKSASATPPVMQFAANPDILATVAALPSAPYCVGFAAESDDVLENARRKLISKRVPLIVANRAQDVFGSDSSAVSLIDANGVTALPTADKVVQARRLISEIAARLTRSATPAASASTRQRATT